MPDPFVELADDARQLTELRSRAAYRGRRHAATEVATFTGTLRDLAERAIPVAVQTSSTRVHRGPLLTVGIDHVAVRRVDGSIALVAFDTVRSVRPEPGVPARAAMGDRERSDDRTLLEALDRFLEADREVVVLLRDIDDPLRGEVLGFGEDVLTLRLAGGDRASVYVPTLAVRELILGR